ncbi:MAG: hypothetical protein HC773_05160 [Scytonema sp. CRU_2_7]|nr:hypothetical protein [Scytonema sp. CRU_2_7]
MSIDFALDPVTHDLLFENDSLQIVTDEDQLAQNLKIRLQFFLGEWFLNTGVGVPFYSEILVKNPNVANIDAIIKAQILDTVGVSQLLEYNSSFSNALRSYSINFTVRTIYGEQQIELSLFDTTI